MQHVTGNTVLSISWFWSLSVQAMICPHSSGGTDGTWTRKPLPTARWLSTSPESRKGTLTSDIILLYFLKIVPPWSSCHLVLNLFRDSFNVVVLTILLCKIPFVLDPLSAEGVMRTMTTEKLLKGMPVLQTQIDTLLEFDVRLFSDSLTVFFLRFSSCWSKSHCPVPPPLRFTPRSWTTGSSMLHSCFSSRTWSNCLHPTTMESSTY